MKILLTNDDGVSAKGIKTLFNTLSKKHNVYIIAPDEEKSGCSSAITFKKDLRVKKISENIFSVQGYTADCVNIGLKGNIIPNVDIVISGINHGPNLGDDIYFSGTVAGARVAFIYGISGIAVSINSSEESRFFNDASNFIENFIENKKIFSNGKALLFNINYPDLPNKEISGIKYSNLGKREYQDTYKGSNNKDGDFSLKFVPKIGPSKTNQSDIVDIKNGFISITPLTLDCTDYNFLKNMQ